MSREGVHPAWDCVVVGAGPAGLNAALVLGRARRRILVLDGAVRVRCADRVELTRTILLATGLLDELPDISGFTDVWGTSAHTCPYCDGYEHRDQRLAVGDRAEHLAILLRQWSDDVVLLSNGRPGLSAGQLARVRAMRVEVIDCANELAAGLGCRLRADGSVVVDADHATTVDRVYAAGNCTDPRALVPAAAGAGATAAVTINARLSFDDADHAVAAAR